MPTLEAGRELDALVAEKIFGWQRRPFECNAEQRVVVPPGWTDFSSRYWWGKDINSQVPAYSTEIGAAWQVAECFDEVQLWKGPHGWSCRMERGEDEHVQHGEALRADTAPLAICRAALAAIETLRTDTPTRPPA